MRRLRPVGTSQTAEQTASHELRQMVDYKINITLVDKGSTGREGGPAQNIRKGIKRNLFHLRLEHLKFCFYMQYFKN